MMRLRIASAIKTIAMIPPSELKTAIAAMLPTRLRSAVSAEVVLVAVEVLVVLLLVDVVDVPDVLVLDVLELLLEELLELVELVVSEEVVLVSAEVVSEEVSELVSDVLSAVVSTLVSAVVAASVVSVAVLESSVESPESSVESARFCLMSVVHVGALLGGGVGSGMVRLRLRAGRAWAGVCAGWSAHASRQRVCRVRRIDNFILMLFCSCSRLLWISFLSQNVQQTGMKEKNRQKRRK